MHWKQYLFLHQLITSGQFLRTLRGAQVSRPREKLNSRVEVRSGLTFNACRPILSLSGLEISGRRKSLEEFRGFLLLWVAIKTRPSHVPLGASQEFCLQHVVGSILLLGIQPLSTDRSRD